MKYSIGARVIYSYHGHWRFGIIENRHTVKRGVYTYDIRAEHGSLYIYVPADVQAQIFIDSHKTSIIAPQIVSNLRYGLTGNVAYEQISEASFTQIA
jgi:hypothetical protein